MTLENTMQEERVPPCGLVSVTLRHQSAREVLAVARKAELEVIQWNSEPHVPPDDRRRVRELGRMMQECGMSVPVYGSYLGRGSELDSAHAIASVMQAARDLGAASVRLWAGGIGSNVIENGMRQKLMRRCKQLVDAALSSGLEPSFEFHRDTLTDTPAATLDFMSDLGTSGVRLIWQPPLGVDPKVALGGLGQLVHLVNAVHVFNWGASPHERFPLAWAVESWKAYAAIVLSRAPECPFLLEFVPGDDPEIVPAELATLRRMLYETARQEAVPGAEVTDVECG